MKNLELFITLLNHYNKLAYTHNYIFGFEYDNNIYYINTDNKYLDIMLTLDKASRGAGYSIRFKPTSKIKQLMFTMFNPVLLCSKEFFKEQFENTKYNKGELFEKMITELNGLEWKKDNNDFTTSGDMEVNGIAYQIKFENATFTNERTLMNLLKRV
jgi:hypothetical protein